MSVLFTMTLRPQAGDMTDRILRTVLWLSAHPEPRSLNGSLRRDGLAALRAAGHRVLESDLYAMGWDPVVRRANLDREAITGRLGVTEIGSTVQIARRGRAA